MALSFIFAVLEVNMSSNVVVHAFHSAPGEGKMLPMGRLKVSSAQSGGALEVFEIGGPLVPQPYMHREHDECFYIIEGNFTFTPGTEEIDAPAGSVVFIPRGTRSTFRHSEGARALIFVLPAGLEDFFHEMAEGIAAGRSEAEMRAALAGKYDTWPAG